MNLRLSRVYGKPPPPFRTIRQCQEGARPSLVESADGDGHEMVRAAEDRRHCQQQDARSGCVVWSARHVDPWLFQDLNQGQG